MKETQDELSDWAKSRLWFLATLVVLVGFFGVRALVREMIAAELREATKAAATANAAAEHARDVSKDVRADASKAQEAILEIQSTAGRLNEDLGDLKTRIDAESAHAIASADLKISGLASQLDEVNRAMRDLASESRESRGALAEHQRRLEQLDHDSAKSTADFDANSKLRIVVVHHGTGTQADALAPLIVARLSALGFKAGPGRWGKGAEVQNRIEIQAPKRLNAQAQQVRAVIDELVAEGQKPAPAVTMNWTEYSGKDGVDVHIWVR